jgi:hypothetical protein
MLANQKRVYALAGFTVELRQKGWFYWPTYGEKNEAKGPYGGMASVTLMIARELKREITKRDAPHPVDACDEH